MEELEKTVQELAARVVRLEQENTRLKDRNEISNLMSRYMYLHAAFKDEEIADELWAREAPDVRAEYGNIGVYEGWEHVTDYHRGRPNPPGKWIFHALSNEMIEIADDGRTAKGVWLLSGTESGSIPEAQAEGVDNFYCKEIVDGQKVWAHWVWSRYGVDFIKENGRWKIWHFHNYNLCRTPFDENWVSYNMKLAKYSEAHKEEPHREIMYCGLEGEVKFFPEPDRESTFRWTYDGRDSISVLAPPLPEPYRTFEETFEY